MWISAIIDCKQSGCHPGQSAIKEVVFLEKNWPVKHADASSAYPGRPRQVRLGHSYKLNSVLLIFR